MEKKLARHVFEINPQDNGGEAVLLITDLLEWDGDRPIYHQTLELNSYRRTATIFLPGDLSPKKLRELADELDAFFDLARTVEGLIKKK